MLEKPKPVTEGNFNLDDFLRGLAGEVDEERVAALPKDEQALDAIAREILKLERDLTLPGSGLSESARVDRLFQFIADKEF